LSPLAPAAAAQHARPRSDLPPLTGGSILPSARTWPSHFRAPGPLTTGGPGASLGAGRRTPGLWVQTPPHGAGLAGREAPRVVPVTRGRAPCDRGRCRPG
jgi:hypothetical protein